MFVHPYLASVKSVDVSYFILLQMAFRRWQRGIHREILSLHRGFVPVKPFIFSDGEVLGEQAQACYYCVIIC